MGQGLQCWRANGELVFESFDNLCRVVGSAQTGGSGFGSIYIPEWETHRPWFTTINPQSENWLLMAPAFFIVGPTVQWSISGVGVGVCPDILLICGVY